MRTGVEPIATGKPDPTMHRETMLRTGAEHPLVVGDRLDTDIEGATAVGCASLLVLTGVTDAGRLLARPAGSAARLRVTDVVGALLDDSPGDGGQSATGHVRCGGMARSERRSARRPVDRAGPARHRGGDDLDALRALCVLRGALGRDRASAE